MSKFTIPPPALFKPSAQDWKPAAFQKKAVKFLVEHAAAGLFLDPGLRKTSATLAAIAFLRKRRLVKRVLVIAPLRVCYLVWPAEATLWKDFHGLRVVVLHGDDKEERLREEADLYVINPAGLDWLTGSVDGTTPNRKRWASLNFDTLVVDELTQFKHTKSKRFKLLKKLLPSFKRRWGLTGSPAANNLEDLFGQVYVLDEGAALGKFITHFRSRYFDPPTFGFRWTIRPGDDELIFKKLKPLALRMAAEDYLDLPQLRENIIRVELPPKARKIYSDMESELLAILASDDIITAANAGVALAKCRQVCSGAVYLDPTFDGAQTAGPKEWREIHEAKLDALEELVDSLQGQPLLVGYEFRHDLERLLKRFGKHTPYLGGGTSMKETVRIADAWNAGAVKLLLAHPMAAGHGLNLQGSSGQHVAWFTLTWDYELLDQFNRRIYRSGTKAKHVTIHQLVARDTVDESVLSALRSKRKGQAALFAALKDQVKSRTKTTK